MARDLHEPIPTRLFGKKAVPHGGMAQDGVARLKWLIKCGQDLFAAVYEHHGFPLVVHEGASARDLSMPPSLCGTTRSWQWTLNTLTLAVSLRRRITVLPPAESTRALKCTGMAASERAADLSAASAAFCDARAVSRAAVVAASLAVADLAAAFALSLAW